VAERFPDSKSTALARPGNSPRVSVRAYKVLRNHKYSIFGISGEMRETPANQRDREFESISLRHRVLGLSILDDVREIRARVRRLMRNAGIRMFCYCQITKTFIERTAGR
jgi:hypothetical protein